jgi:hypothetical protein
MLMTFFNINFRLLSAGIRLYLHLRRLALYIIQLFVTQDLKRKPGHLVNGCLVGWLHIESVRIEHTRISFFSCQV